MFNQICSLVLLATYLLCLFLYQVINHLSQFYSSTNVLNIIGYLLFEWVQHLQNNFFSLLLLILILILKVVLFIYDVQIWILDNNIPILFTLLSYFSWEIIIADLINIQLLPIRLTALSLSIRFGINVWTVNDILIWH